VLGATLIENVKDFMSSLEKRKESCRKWSYGRPEFHRCNFWLCKNV